jgi:hypothetical protein
MSFIIALYRLVSALFLGHDDNPCGWIVGCVECVS